VEEVTIIDNNFFRKPGFIVWFSKGFIKRIFFIEYLNFIFLLVGKKKKSCTFAQLLKKQYQNDRFLDHLATFCGGFSKTMYSQCYNRKEQNIESNRREGIRDLLIEEVLFHSEPLL